MHRLFSQAFDYRKRYFGDTLYFYIPDLIHYETSFYKSINQYRFPAISITAGYCSLNCDHCQGKLLEPMIPATTKEMLYNVCKSIYENNGVGCLISGGSLYDGRVPIDRYLDVIEKVKREFGLKIVIHTGIVDKATIKKMAKINIDGVLIDIIGDKRTLEEVYHLNYDTKVYDEILLNLTQYGVPVIPHIVVGLHYGKIIGEYKALDMISNYEVAAIVIVILNPYPGTPMEQIPPPPILDTAELICKARIKNPDTPLLLGCARPRGIYKIVIEALAIKAGVNGIAFPSDESMRIAKRHGLDVKIYPECCALIWRVIGEDR
jgi:hypothetical protein